MAVDELDLFMSKLEDRGIITGWSEFMQKEEDGCKGRREENDRIIPDRKTICDPGERIKI